MENFINVNLALGSIVFLGFSVVVLVFKYKKGEIYTPETIFGLLGAVCNLAVIINYVILIIG
jgi:ABC-type methionine transport system permease subunit